MDVTSTPTRLRFYRFLPYWAVFQTDLRQTPRNWVWRTWVFVSIAAAMLYLTHRFAMFKEANFVLKGDVIVANLLRSIALGTVTLVVAFCSGAIATERGSLADSVLCRGISRYQYFLAKLHSRLIAVLVTYLSLTIAVMVTAGFVFPGLMTTAGCIAALTALAAVLAAIVSISITTSALCGSTVLTVTLLWVGLYSLGFALTFVPTNYLTPDRLIDALPNMLKGIYDRDEYWRLVKWSCITVCVSALIGMVGFSRSDV
jgi:ABC-2 type transport system permease protein